MIDCLKQNAEHVKVLNYGWQPDGDPASATQNTQALQKAIDQSLVLNTAVEIPGSPDRAYVNTGQVTLPNNIESTVWLKGCGKRNSVIDGLGSGAIIQVGETAQATPNSEQDWAGLQISDLALITQTASRGVGFMWRYADTHFERVHFEGFSEDGVGDMVSLPKSWTKTFNSCSFAYCNRGIRSTDHVLHVDELCRFYWNNVGIELNGQAFVSIEGDFGPAAEAHVKFSGNTSTAFIRAYMENGYDTTGATTPFKAVSIDPRVKQLSPAGGILIENASVLGLTIDTCHVQMQASDWFIRINNNNNETVRFKWCGGITVKDNTGTGDIVQNIGTSSNIKNCVWEHVYTSPGNWANLTNDPSMFCVMPSGFGINVC